MSKIKRIRIFAGPNGSGKSTLFHHVNAIVDTGIFVNADVLENTLTKKGLFDLNDFGIKSTQDDLSLFLKTISAKSLVEKTDREGLKIDISINENFIIDASKETHIREI